ncbi:hypothetical protein G6K87_05755 [Agrobacterium tumefaciens]
MFAFELRYPTGPAVVARALSRHPLPNDFDRISINANHHGLLASLDASLQLVVAWSAK